MDESKDIRERFPPLRVRCRNAKEGGYCHHWCDFCHGSGWEITEFGEEVLALVKMGRAKIFGDD